MTKFGLTILGFYLGGAILFGLLAWFLAPPVGGEFWIYIRLFVTLISASIGATVGQIALLAVVFMSDVVGR